MSKRADATTTIRNRLGLHARPAMAFVDAAMAFESTITVQRDEPGAMDPVDGKSIMQMMMLAATKGTKLRTTAEGADAQAACARLKALVESGFDEDR